MKQEMRVLSVNSARAAPLVNETARHNNGPEVLSSAIRKRPHSDAVRVDADGIAGDEQADRRFHGGPDQAVYAYRAEDYRFWEQSLGRPLAYGTLGENLAIEGLPDDLFIGDRLLAGTVVLEVTGPRMPCSKLAAVTGEDDIVRRFIDAERPGFYLRVLSPGLLAAGDIVSLVPLQAPAISVVDVFRLYYEAPGDRERLRQSLEAPLAERLRARFEKRLQAQPAPE